MGEKGEKERMRERPLLVEEGGQPPTEWATRTSEENEREKETERETILVVFTSAFRRKEKVTTRGGWLKEKKWKIVASQRYSRYHPLSYLTATTISIAQQSPSPLQSLSLFLSLLSRARLFSAILLAGLVEKKMKEYAG